MLARSQRIGRTRAYLSTMRHDKSVIHTRDMQPKKNKRVVRFLG
jgi:hypothetical protein